MHPHVGVELTDVDVRTVGDELVESVQAALLEHGLVAIRDQELGPAELAAFTSALGTAEEFDTSPFAAYPQVLRISNLEGTDEAPPPYWHADGILQPEPPLLTLFYAEQVSSEGGDTLFLDAHRAYAELPAELRSRLEGLRSVQANGVEHPIARTHPVSGRRALYLDFGITVGVAGLDRDEAVALFTELRAHLERPGAVYRHQFRQGDLLIWDNVAVAHSATRAPGPRQARVMLRSTVRGGPTG